MNGVSASEAQPAAVPAASDSGGAERHREIMDAISELGRKVAGGASEAQSSGVPAALLEQYKAELREAAKLTHQLSELQEAIDKTKREIAILYEDGASGERLGQIVDELEHVVGGTETATDTILAAAEKIDGDMTGFIRSLPEGVDDTAAAEAQEQVIKIMEACNFQDLTGQRITKVVKALRFIEDRVGAMRDIWGEKSFDGIELDKPEIDEDDPQSLLHGPAREGEEGRSTQDDIDALFD